MSTRARSFEGSVLRREPLSPHLVRLLLRVPDLVSTGVPDEWVGLVVPGQFQHRYYTVRALDGDLLTLDVVLHDHGLVTEWASGDCVGDRVVVTEPKGSFDPPPDAGWLLLVGDLTALPAMARITETTDLPVRLWAEVADDLAGYLPVPSAGSGRTGRAHAAEVTWLLPPGPSASALAEVVREIDWPAGPGYFWMAGESAQMRAIRKHLMRERLLSATAYDVMGYWRGGTDRQPRAVDPGPIWRAGKAQGKSDEEIWADYDAAREAP